MDYLDILMTQHQEIRELLEGARKSPSVADRTRALEKARSAIELHTYLEETYVYPALEDYDNLKRQVFGFWQEHERVREELQGVLSVHQQEEEFQRRIQQLMSDLEDHLREEERHVFPEARRLLGATRLRNISEKLKDALGERRIAA